jgi:putative serine/threonine protein kinase
LKAPIKVLTENLKIEPYASALCYPRGSKTEIESRLEELCEHGVTAVDFAGEANIFNLPVLGKGFVGIVVIANLGEKRAALKIRRVDADRLGLEQEAQMLAKANSVQVGPRLISVSRNFLLMQLIQGCLLPSWLDLHNDEGQVRGVLGEVLEQCWRLDSIKLDHGELSKAPKHIIISEQQEPFIIDFETASVNRKPANVTSLCQFLFTGYGLVAKSVAEVLGEVNRVEVIDVLRRYKSGRKRENFDDILQVCLG